MKILSLLAAICLFASTSFADPVEPSRDDVIRMMQQIAAQTPVRADLEALGFRGENLELAVKQTQVFVQDKGIAGYMADRLIAANKGQIPKEARSGGLVDPLVNRGISHLSLNEMRLYYRVEHSIMNALPLRECGRAMKGRPQTERQYNIAAQVEAQMKAATLREYYRIQLKAARLGLRNRAKTLSPERQAEITEKIFTRLAEKVADAKDARGLIMAYENINRVSNRRACAAGRLFMETVLSLQGHDLRDALIMLSAY